MTMSGDAVRAVMQWLEEHGYGELAGAVWLLADPVVLPAATAWPDDIDGPVEEVVRGLKEAGYQEVAARVGIVVAVVTTTSDPAERRLLIGTLAAIQCATAGSN